MLHSEVRNVGINLQKQKGYHKGWVYHQLVKFPELNLSLSDWQEVGRRLEYKPGWAWHKWQEMQELQRA